MSKFKNGSLKSSNGKKVTSRKQAIAIGLSESGQSKREKKSDKKKSEGHVKSEKAMTKAANRRSRNKGRS